MRWILSVYLLVAFFDVSPARWENVAAEWEGATPVEREWFRGVRSPGGIPCCDVADGHRTTFEWRQDEEGGHFWVPIEGMWVMVPKEAVVWNAGNPFDTSVVWYTSRGIDHIYYIRCFVPVGGV